MYVCDITHVHVMRLIDIRQVDLCIETYLVPFIHVCDMTNIYVTRKIDFDLHLDPGMCGDVCV